MRIRELLLKAFGPFTELDLNLDAPPGAVNVLFGENEAGKSSALRALEGFCFGIPDRTADDHVHNYDQMRVGASLEMADGTRSAFIRRKGKKNTLLDLSGAAVPDDAFDKFLCGVGRSGFEALFCLSYKRLNEGSDSVLEEGGELGKLLFEARSDLSLRLVQKTLEERMSALYRGSARSPAVIDEALRTFDNQRKIVRKGDFVEYRDLNARLDTLKLQAETSKRELDNYRRERQRLDRLHSAIPLVVRLRRAERSLTDLGEVPHLDHDFGHEFSKAKHLKVQAETNHAGTSANLKSVERRLAEISVDGDILTWQAEIERLNTQVDRINSHLQDAPKEEIKAAGALAEARSALARIRPDEEPDELNLRIDQAQKRISSLGRDKASLDQRLENARTDKATIERRLAEQRAKLLETAAIQIPNSLTLAVASARFLGDAETRLDEKRKDLRTLQLVCAQSAAQLGGGARSAQEFARSQVPPRTVIEQFEDEWRTYEDQMKRLRDAHAKAEAAKTASESERSAFVLAGDVPTEADLVEVRERRDSHWRDLRQLGSGRHAVPLEIEDLDEFEGEIAEADRVSDRLRHEADRSAALAAIESRIKTATDLADSTAKSLAEAQSESDKLVVRWRARWEPSQIVPDSPRQMIEWISKFEQLGKDAVRLDELQLDIADRVDQIANASSGLASALSVDGKVASLAQLLAEADALIRSSEYSGVLIADLNQRIRADSSSLEAANAQVQEIESRLEEWRIAWKAETACLRLDRVPSPDEADDAVKAITTAAERLGTARIAQKRALGMHHDHQIFAEATETVVMAVAPDLLGVPAVAAIQNLYRRLSESTKLDAKRTELLTQQAEQMEMLGASAADLESAQHKLVELCRRAACDQVEQLEGVVERHRQSIELKRTVSELTEQLEIASAGKSLDEFCLEVDAIDADTVLLQLNEFQVEIEKLEGTLEQIARDIGKEEERLTNLDNEKTQIDSQIAAEDALAKVRSVVRPYLVYALAESLIRAQIEEFRRANQGPILKKAGEIFSVLTDGSFTELTVELDDKDQPLLVAVRPSRHNGAEQRLKVEALSSATRIGLYLSLRLACLYHHVEQREGLPFVADDILLDFDDARARRVMQELGRLAEKTQVILFTHHRHLVEIGKEVLGDKCLVQSLSR